MPPQQTGIEIMAGKTKRCAQDNDQAQTALQARLDWQNLIDTAPVPLDGLPKPIAEKAIQIMTELKNGKSYMAFRGKRLLAMGKRQVISVPIGRRYRLICRKKTEGLRYLEVITHQKYNNRLSSGGLAW